MFSEASSSPHPGPHQIWRQQLVGGLMTGRRSRQHTDREGHGTDHRQTLIWWRSERLGPGDTSGSQRLESPGGGHGGGITAVGVGNVT